MGSRFSAELAPFYELFKNPSEQRQYRVLVETYTLFVCNISFAACSPVFKAAVFGNFKEKHENQFKFPDKTLIQILEMFACTFAITECPRRQVDVTNFAILLDLAEEYFIEVKLILKFYFFSFLFDYRLKLNVA